MTCLQNANDSFAFSLVCKLFAHIFSQHANDKKAQFVVSVTDWVKPKTKHPNFQLSYQTNVLPDGTLNGGRYTMGYTEFSYNHLVGLIMVQFGQRKTRWTSLVSNWELEFNPCRVCYKRHCMWKMEPYTPFRLMQHVEIRGSIRCAVVKYARDLKLRMHVEEEENERKRRNVVSTVMKDIF